MDNIVFKKIENIKIYLAEGLKNGKLQSRTYQKFGEITARSGIVGEQIVTIMSDGLKETKNTVVADEKGNPGWVVTNATNEQYIVKDLDFKAKYEKIDGTANKYKPVWYPITAAQIDENICFVAPWGEIQNLLAGGYLVFNEDFDDIYGVQEKEFVKTYKNINI